MFRGYLSFKPSIQPSILALFIVDKDLILFNKIKSASSTIIKAGVGNILLGPIGLLAGVAGKQKGIYNIALHFKDGKKSLIEVDEKIYKKLLQNVFQVNKQLLAFLFNLNYIDMLNIVYL